MALSDIELQDFLSGLSEEQQKQLFDVKSTIWHSVMH